MPVYQIIGMIANGDTVESLLEEFPSLMREDIFACFDYAASSPGQMGASAVAEMVGVPTEGMGEPHLC